MVAEVYFAPRRATMGGGLLEKTDRLFTVAEFARFPPNAQVGIKMTFPEWGNTTHVRPQFIRRIVERIWQTGGKPFLTDALRFPDAGRSGRAVDVLVNMLEQGFSYTSVRAPLVLANGLNGADRSTVENRGQHLPSASIPNALLQADALIVISHFTGHGQLGFAGALVNLGLCCLPEGREPDETGPPAADATLGYRVVEAFAALVQNKKNRCGYFNFLLEITPETDYCRSDAPITPDVGILAACDPVAIDQASIDLVNQQSGIGNTRPQPAGPGEKMRPLLPSSRWRRVLEYAEELGLGSRSYELMVV